MIKGTSLGRPPPTVPTLRPASAGAAVPPGPRSARLPPRRTITECATIKEVHQAMASLVPPWVVAQAHISRCWCGDDVPPPRRSGDQGVRVPPSRPTGLGRVRGWQPDRPAAARGARVPGVVGSGDALVEEQGEDEQEAGRTNRGPERQVDCLLSHAIRCRCWRKRAGLRAVRWPWTCWGWAVCGTRRGPRRGARACCCDCLDSVSGQPASQPAS